jgi:hypothetical protein
MCPTEKPAKFIEAAVIRNFTLERAHMPFAEGAGCVAGLGQMLR